MDKVRFAPVPSGNIHLGGLRVFLANWLFVKKNNADFIMRFEDTNPRISFFEYKESLLRTLLWLDFKEPFEIFEQSERHNIYHKIAINLVRRGYVYPCFCQKEDLCKRLKKKNTKSREKFSYDGYCRNLTLEEISLKIKRGEKPAYRFKVEPGKITFSDMIKGEISFHTSSLSDFIILRSDSTGTYNFACTIDDILMNITHIIRGEDHLSNTPRQILIYRALNVSLPQFAHLPLLLSKDGRKYSKSSGSFSIFDLKREGFLPEAILNYIFYSGLSKNKEKRLLTPDEMAKTFLLSDISPSYIHFDKDSLNHFNRLAMEKINTSSAEGMAFDFLKARGVINKPPGKNRMKLLRGLLPELKKRAAGLLELSSAFCSIISDKPLLSAEGKRYIEKFPKHMEELKKLAAGVRTTKDFKKKVLNNKKLFGKPLRILVTGQKEGVPVEVILKNITLKGLRRKLEKRPGRTFLETETNKIEKNRIKYYFLKKFALKVTEIERLWSIRNSSWKVVCEDKKFIVKIGVEADFEKLYNEKNSLQGLGKFGLSPEKPYLDLSKEYFSEPLLIYNRVEGRTLKTIAPGHYEAIADYLCRLHSYAVLSLPQMGINNINDFYEDLSEVYNIYMNLREEEGLREDKLCNLIGEYISLIKPEIMKISSLWSHKSPLSVIHGDLRPSNLILNNGKIAAVDWEEACLGDPAYEISSFFILNSFTPEEEEKFLKFYLKFYEKKFPYDYYFKERLTGYNLINYIFYYLNMTVRAIELLQGNKKTAMPLIPYLHSEAEEVYEGLALSFCRINKMLNKGAEKITPNDLKKAGRLFMIPPEVKEGTVIVIDGPASTGKSIISPLLAKRLGFFYINLGAFFRTLVFKLLELNMSHDSPDLYEAIENFKIEYENTKEPPYFKILISGKDITSIIYNVKIEENVAYYSGKKTLIDFIKKEIQELLKYKRGAVVEGRKGAAEFFPEADFKFFLTLNKEERIRLKKEQISDLYNEKLEKESISSILSKRDELDFSSVPEGIDYKKIELSSINTGRALSEIFNYISGEK